jgi:small subunit ribosomal protein S21
MSWVKAKAGESFESLMKRFKKAVERSGILTDLKKHEFYEKPSVKRKRKQAAARKRAIKNAKKVERSSARKGKNINFKWNKDHTKKIPLPPPRKYVPKKKDFKSSGPSKSRFTKNPTIKGNKL